MKKFFRRLLRVFLFLILFLIVVTGILLHYLGPIAKYEVEKNSMKWLGRRITLASIDVNAWNGSVKVKDIKIYETDTTKVFFSCHSIFLQVSIPRLLAKIYKVEEVRIVEPEINITQDGNKFNFDDLTNRFASRRSSDDTVLKAPSAKFYIHNIKLIKGDVTYNDVPLHNIFKIHNINFNCPEFAWNTVMATLHLDFKYGTGGNFNIDAAINRKTFDFNVTLGIDSYDLSQYYAPVNNYIKISSFNGQLNTKLRMHGNTKSPKDFSMVGYLHLNDVEIKDSANKKLFALGELVISVDTINVKHNQYIFHTIALDNPYMAFNYYDNGSNLSHLIKRQAVKESKEEVQKTVKDSAHGKAKLDYSNIFTLLSSSIKNMAVNYLGANYHADSIAIRNGEFVFNDNTKDNKFHYKVSKINLSTNEIGAKNSSVVFKASALLNDTGKFNLQANIQYDLRRKKLNYKITTLGIHHISPIVKYVIEKYDVNTIGRQVTINHISVNAMNGSVNIKDIKIFEANSDKVFFGCHDLYIKLDLPQLFTGVYGIDTILIDQPAISIEQNGNKFNFDDLKKRFSSDTNKKQPGDSSKTATTDSLNPIQYFVRNVIIQNGNVTYTNVPIHNVASIHNINFKLPDVSWNKPKSQVHLDFQYGKGGTFNIDMNADLKTKDYSVLLNIDNYDLSQYYAPLNKFLAISSLKGLLNTNLNIHGNFSRSKEISSVGYIRVNDFEMDDTTNRKVFAMGTLLIDIDTVNLKNGIYSVNSILMDKPYMRFDYYPNGNNISQMIKYTSPPAPVTDNTTGEIKPDYSNIFTLLSSSIKLLASDFFNTNYHTDSVLIKHGEFVFNDYTLNTPFHYDISHLSLTTDEISAKSKNIAFRAKARLNDTGKIVMNANMSIDMKNMLINYNVTSLRLSDLNPYFEYYVGTPFLDGYMNYQSSDSVINRNLKSTNLIHITGIKAGKKIPGKPVYNIPVRTAISILTDEKGNIDLNIPANGNLDDPNYKVGKIIWPTISDVLKKTAESPFRILAKAFDKKPEEMKQFNFDYLQDKLTDVQTSKLEDIHKVLNRMKDLNVEITQVIDSTEEKNELALMLAKKQYYDETKHEVNDSLLSKRKQKKEDRASGKIATQDTLFDKYLDQKLNLTGNELMTVEDKCIKLVGDAVLNQRIHDLIQQRNEEVHDFLVKKKSLPEERVKVVLSKDSILIRNTPDPQFTIKYSAEN